MLRLMMRLEVLSGILPAQEYVLDSLGE